MTIIEMHDYVDLLLDKANSPWFTSDEKDKFLNLAQDEFVENRYDKFELDERTRKELLPLVRLETGSSVSVIDINLIPNFRYTLNLIGEFNKTCGTGTMFNRIHPLQLDDEGSNENDPFNKSSDSNPCYIECNNGAANEIIIKSDNVPLTYKLKYLASPRDVLRDLVDPLNNIDSELPEFMHEDLVYIAVRKMMGNTEQQLNYQIQQNEEQK